MDSDGTERERKKEEKQRIGQMIEEAVSINPIAGRLFFRALTARMAPFSAAAGVAVNKAQRSTSIAHSLP